MPKEALSHFVYGRSPKAETTSKPFKVIHLSEHTTIKIMMAFVDNGEEAYIIGIEGLTLVSEAGKATRRMTNRELSEYLATGKGQCCISAGGIVVTNYAYDKGDDNEPCNSKYTIRGWNETEWHEPLVSETKDEKVDEMEAKVL